MSLLHGLNSSGQVVPVQVSASGAVQITSTALTTVSNVTDNSVWTGAAVVSNGLDIFTIAGGPILIYQLGSLCITANDGTASTFQYRADGTDGAATTISGASASLASAAAGSVVAVVPGTLATAAALYANGVGLATNIPIIVPAGILEIVVGVGSTTGTWRHFLRWAPLNSVPVTVTAAF